MLREAKDLRSSPRGTLYPRYLIMAAHPLLVLILGPTGSGKTAVSLRLAEHFGGEILSCDSVAVYRGMELGTAKPSAEERARIPHHLLDIADPPEAMTAGAWARAAREVTPTLVERGRLPIVSGGTGLYLRAFTEGMSPLPPRCPSLRERLSSTAAVRPPEYLHRILGRVDREAAARIHANDTPKLIRAIEIALLRTGQVRGNDAALERPLEGYRLLRIGLNPDRKLLYQRLNARAAAMFADGLLEETRHLRERWGPHAQALGALGYREAGLVLDGLLREQDASTAVQQGHRNYAKRQLTWFRREPDVHWLTNFGDEPGTQQQALRLVEETLEA